MMKRRKLVVGAMLVVIGMLAWLLIRSAKPETQISLKPPTRSLPANVAHEIEISERRNRESSSVAHLHARNLTRHDVGQLKDFILPNLRGREVSFGEALRILKDAYQEACFRSQEKPLALAFSVRDEPDHAISFSMSGTSFLACLNHLAALAGLSVDREELNFVFSRSTSATHPAEVSIEKEERTMSQLRALAGQDSGEAGNDWESLLRSTGLLLEKGTSLTEGRDGFLLVKGSKAEIERVKSAMALAAQNPILLKFTEKLLTTNSPLDLTEKTLSEPETQELLRSLAQMKGTEIMTTPSTVVREGQSATMEILRETMTNGQQDWTGIRNTHHAARTGLKVVGTDHSENRPEDAGQLGWSRETETSIPPGGTHVQLLASRDGTYRYRFLTVAPMDAAGRPLVTGNVFPKVDTDTDGAQPSGHFESPIANSVPGKNGFVFSPHNNKVVDVSAIPSGTLVADPTYPVAERRYFRVP
jgi:hypothetical protein